MHVMRRLGRTPHREFAIRHVMLYRRMLLDGQMRIPLKKERVLLNIVGSGKACAHRPSFERRDAMDRAHPAVGMNTRFWVPQGSLNGQGGTQHFGFDPDMVQG